MMRLININEINSQIRIEGSSVSPSLVAVVALHEPRHGLVAGPDLLHVFAEGLLLMAVPALLAGILIHVLLHLVVEASVALLQLRKLALPDGLPGLLVKVDLVVVFGQLARGNLAPQHLLLGLLAALPGKPVAD